MSPEARYDAVVDFYVERFGGDRADEMLDPTVLAMLGDVAGLRVLDLACGDGRLTRVLHRRGADVVGVDLSVGLLREAKRQSPASIGFLQGDAADPELLRGTTFDRILSNMALSDIEDLTGTLANVRRLLAPGGVFVFTIVHPCFPGYGEGLPAWPPDEGYRSERWWTTGGDGMRGKVGAHHRMLSTYLNAVVDAGLWLTRVDEPEWVPGLPGLLAVRCRG